MRIASLLALILLVLVVGSAAAQESTDSMEIQVSVIDSSGNGVDPVTLPTDPPVDRSADPPVDPTTDPPADPPIDPRDDPVRDPFAAARPLKVSALPNTGAGPVGQTEWVQFRSVLAGISMLMVGVAGVAFTYESWNQGLTGQRVEERNVS